MRFSVSVGFIILSVRSAPALDRNSLGLLGKLMKRPISLVFLRGLNLSNLAKVVKTR